MHVEDVLTIAVQEPDALLIAQQAQVPFGQVKQRADAGVGLAVVVPERAFVIAAQLRYAVVGGNCPIVAEGLVHFKFHSLVFAFRILVSIRLAVPVELAAKGSAVTGLAKRNLALLEAGAVRKQIAAGIKPSVRVDRRETCASGRSGAPVGCVETVELVISDEWRWIAFGIETSQRQSRSIRRDGLARTKHDFLRIDEDILLGVGIADEVVQTAAIGNERIEKLDGDAALVLDDALQPAVNVTHAGHDAAAELVIISHHEFVGILHAGPRCERLASADQVTPRNGYSARRVVEKVS